MSRSTNSTILFVGVVLVIVITISEVRLLNKMEAIVKVQQDTIKEIRKKNEKVKQ